MNAQNELERLLHDAEEAHREAHGYSKDEHADWPIWFATYLHDAFTSVFDIQISKSELVHCLMQAETEHKARAGEENWVTFYARFLLERLSPGSGTDEKLALYYYDACPFCQLVLREIRDLGVDVELRNVLHTPEYREELIDVRGRGTVPVLRIMSGDGSDRWMPESRDIVRYLGQRFG